MDIIMMRNICTCYIEIEKGIYGVFFFSSKLLQISSKHGFQVSVNTSTIWLKDRKKDEYWL